ncbi:hypothetical protein BJ912DRAFT_1150275 [Pholiota molesta]|nr:hypothetical protein BJ912DRAFT_1150275 [Pholiota molesta]
MTDSDRVVHCMADSATTLSTETSRFERCRGLEVGNRAAAYDSDARHTNHRTAKTDTAWLSQWPTIAAITEQGGMNGQRKRKRREESGARTAVSVLRKRCPFRIFQPSNRRMIRAKAPALHEAAYDDDEIAARNAAPVTREHTSTSRRGVKHSVLGNRTLYTSRPAGTRGAHAADDGTAPLSNTEYRICARRMHREITRERRRPSTCAPLSYSVDE